jgi:hypothetical protein
MTIKHGEHRRSRASFTRTLRRIAARIAEQRIYQLEWDDKLLRKSQKANIRVSELWVAGSYARGALDCGDLDLVVNLIVEEGDSPWRATVSRAVLGSAPDVRLYIGTPEKNSSGAVFTEAKLVWSLNAPDWQTAISAIVIEPLATRYARPTDELPLRIEQFYADDNSVLDKLLELKHNQIIDWNWIPADEINVRADDWPDEVREFGDYLRRWRGKKTQAVMQLVIEYFSQQDQCVTWRKDLDERTWFRFGGACVLVGRQPILVQLLNHLFCSQVVIAAHLSRRGPNGLWIISRGVNHPLEQAFREVTAYYLKDEQCPEVIEESEVGNWRSIYSLELLQSRKHAKERAKEEKAEFEINIEIAMATGSKLLHLIAAVDVIEVGEVRLPISVEGMQFEGEEELASANNLLALLANPSDAAA